MPLTLRSSTSFITKTSFFKTGNDTVLSTPTTLFFSKITTTTSSISASSSSSSPQNTEKVHAVSIPHSRNSDNKNNAKVPVYVMLPLDTVTLSGHLYKPKAMNVSLMALKNAGVEGVMVDAWWGLVEKEGPMKYNWEGYAELVEMVGKHGLKIQVVMSFHQCGGNVGDSCSIPLPPWVLEEISKNTDLVYTDRSGRRNPEYISLGCDSLPVLRGRTPIQVYTDFMRSFRQRFTHYLGSVVAEVQVGMGPCGELRYPAYPESNGTWRFPGIGEFQCYDKYMRASLQASAEAAGHQEWGITGPHDSGQYNQYPEETGFFKRDGTWNTEYGQFFLEWYSAKLLEHGDKILAAADATFQGTGTKLSGKVAGIHWHYKTRSHAAELTAGYYNTRHHDGYLAIAKMMKRYEVVLNFTCMEMKDGEQPDHAECSPEGLVKQVKMAARLAGIELAGENALERYDAGAYGQVMATSRSDSGNGLSAFTFLRLNKRLFEGENWRNLVDFVRNMSEGGRKPRHAEEDLIFVGFVIEKKDADNKELALAALV